MTLKQQIHDFLHDYHVGADNAVYSRKLCSVCGVSSPLLRRTINELRVDGTPVCSDSNGYFFAANTREIDITMAHLASRSNEMIKAREGLARAKESFVGEGLSEEDGG